MIESLTYENAKNKENLLEVTANYESRVSNLTQNRNDLSQQIEKHLNRIAELESLLDK